MANLLAVFDRQCWPVAHPGEADNGNAGDVQALSLRCACVAAGLEHACCVAVGALSDLHKLNLNHSDVVICAATLRDASGLDALAYVRGIRPDLPMILTGPDASMAVEAIRGGALDFLVTTTAHDYNNLPLAVEKCLVHQRISQENERLHHDLKRSLAELAVTNQQLQSVIRQLEAMARTDELTGLSNRRWFNLSLEGSWADAVKNQVPLACLMIDLDCFKSVNDRLGHHRGDELLKLAAKVIRANCREVDVAARYGGDEFCVLLTHAEPLAAAMVAERILHEFQTVVRRLPGVACAPGIGIAGAGDRAGADTTTVSMSIGVSHTTLSRPPSAEQLVSHADEAMYAAKSAGKQRVMVRDADGVYAPMCRDAA